MIRHLILFLNIFSQKTGIFFCPKAIRMIAVKKISGEIQANLLIMFIGIPVAISVALYNVLQRIVNCLLFPIQHLRAYDKKRLQLPVITKRKQALQRFSAFWRYFTPFFRQKTVRLLHTVVLFKPFPTLIGKYRFIFAVFPLLFIAESLCVGMILRNIKIERPNIHFFRIGTFLHVIMDIFPPDRRKQTHAVRTIPQAQVIHFIAPCNKRSQFHHKQPRLLRSKRLPDIVLAAVRLQRIGSIRVRGETIFLPRTKRLPVADRRTAPHINHIQILLLLQSENPQPVRIGISEQICQKGKCSDKKTEKQHTQYDIFNSAFPCSIHPKILCK